MQIIFIGGGNMAEAIFSRLYDLGLNIIVVQRNLDKRSRLAAAYSFIRFLPKLDFIPAKEDILILAVKPQDAKQSCQSLPIINCAIVSLMAGINTTTLARWLNSKLLIRVMPNTAASLGLSVTGIYYTPDVLPQHRKIVESIMSHIGTNYIVKDENTINKFTAIAASAPAYIFYFVEGLIETAITQFGFSPTEAHNITLQVLKGSLTMIELNPNIPIKKLRANITSNKGTTEEAINIFDKQNLKLIIKEAELACYSRAQELAEAINKE
ncbi:MAG: pyrroline-5-carboxylate reductase [Burkholderiales bacterium]|nr:pyrroline-5-carboxylate reductase [Burkholderiales bacterium]